MKIRALTLGLVSAAVLSSAVLLPMAASAQGLRPAGTPQAPRLTPSVTLPAATATGGRTTTRSADFIVAVVNSEPITNNDVQIRMERVRAQMAGQGGGQQVAGEEAARSHAFSPGVVVAMKNIAACAYG